MRNLRSTARLAAAALALAVLAACAAAPPKPAMVPLGQTGDFGYSERDVGPDKVEVTYTGSNIRVSGVQGRSDSRVTAEHAKTRDLALWRAAQVADQRGMEAMKVESETRDTDVQTTPRYVYRPYPYYGAYSFRRHYCCGPSWFYNDDYYIEPIPRAAAQSTTTLTVQLFKTRDPNDATQISVKETLSRLQAERSGAAY